MSFNDWNDAMTNTNSVVAQHVARDPNFCFTNPEMAKHLISQINFNNNDIVMEPCKGSGSFYNNLPANITKEFCEINEGRDYLNYNGHVDITLSNPPFTPRKLFWDFHKKAMETTRREIYWLINMASLNVFTPKRLKEMNDLGWFINSFHIVTDKRWFGRYVWVKISKINNNVLTYNNKVF
jgi:hypothetical protein